MRIAVVTSSFPRQADDPSGHFVLAEVRELLAAGHRVTVIAPGAPHGTAAAEVDVCWISDAGLFGWPGALARAREAPWRLRGALRFVLGARRALVRLGPFDRVVLHWLIPSGWPIGVGLKQPLEVVAHGSDVRLLCRLPPVLARQVLAPLLRGGTRLRFVSHELLAALALVVPEIREYSFVKPAALDLGEAVTRAEARRVLGVSLDQRLLVVVSRLIASKRVAVALGAARLIPEARIVVVGDGPERERLGQSFPEAEFTGQLPRSRALLWIAAADLLISPSRQEGAPSAVREARAMGVQVVAAPAGDLEAWAEVDSGLHVVSRAPLP